MKYILISLFIFIIANANAQGFTSTDSLRTYNIKYITNNAATAFTNLRLHTLLRGIIDWVDTARAGTGGGGAIGVDTIYALNDSTLRYRKNGVFRNTILKGVYDTRRKVDTAYALNDSTLQIKINGTNRNIIMPGRHWTLQQVLTNGSTLDSNFTVILADSIKFTSGFVIIDSLRLPALSAQTDTTTYKPLSIDASGNVSKMSIWPITPGTDTTGLSNRIDLKLNISDTTNKWINDIRRSNDSVYALKNDTWQFKFIDSTGGSSSNLRLDLPNLSETKIYTPAKGVASSSSVSGYSHTAVDSARYKFTTSGTGGEKGGWISTAASGDSIRVTAPFWIIFGNSIAEGHGGPVSLHGRLHPAGANTFQWDYDDVPGQLSYAFRALTHMRFYNQAIGGQTSVQGRIRAFRDMLSQFSANTTDSRGNQTLFRQAQGVIIEFGINDIYNGVPLQTLKDNIEWMASQCQQRGIRCVVLNCPGDATATESFLKLIAEYNLWLASGALDQYGACVVDFNRWWNDPAYGYDNIHPTSLIYDDVHPRTDGGYDSLALYIFNQAKLPVLTKAVFSTEVSPTNAARVAYPTSVNINNVTYALTSNVDTIDITSYVPDSVWIKINSSTAINGDTAAVGHIEWYVDNNVSDSLWYTKRTLYSGSQKANMNVSDITLISPTLINGHDVIKTYLGDLTTVGFTVRHYAGTARIMLNGETILNSAGLTINGGGTSIGTDGNIKSTGTASQFGVLEINQNANAGTTGFGISSANTESSIRFMGTASQGKDLFRFSNYNGIGASNLATTPLALINITGCGIGNPTGANQTGSALSIRPTYNVTVGAHTGTRIHGIWYDPTLTLITGVKHDAFYQTTGNNYFNIVSDSTCFGCDSTVSPGGKVHIKGALRLDDVIPPAGSYNVLVHDADSVVKQVPVASLGVITSINSQAGPAITISGDATTGISVSAATNTVTIADNTDLESFNSDANNTGTGETDLYSHTLAANKLTLNGKGVRFRITGTNNDATATAQIQGYFAGTNIFDSGALTMTAAGDWFIEMEIQRTTSTTAAATVTFSCANTTVTLPVKYTALTSQDWTTTNIFKITGTAGGAGGGSNDITSHAGKVVFVP